MKILFTSKKYSVYDDEIYICFIKDLYSNYITKLPYIR